MKTIKKFEFKQVAKSGSKYPWDQLFDGSIYQITKGEDYDVETDAMSPKIKTASRRRYKNVKISRHDANGKKLEDALILQAFDMTAEERASEDARREVEKANRASQKEEESEETTAAA